MKSYRVIRHDVLGVGNTRARMVYRGNLLACALRAAFELARGASSVSLVRGARV